MALTVSPSTLTTLGPINWNVNSDDAALAYDQAFFDRVVVAPQGVGQIGGFIFDYEGDDTVSKESDVTDHFLEDNTAVQDHIGIRPVIVTLRGFVSELTLNKQLGIKLIGILGAVQTTLTVVPAYTGKYGAGTLAAMQKAISQAQNIAIQIQQAIARIMQLKQFLPGGTFMNKQQNAFAQLESLQDARIVFTIFTPFRVYDNMVITSLKAVQSEKTKTMTDFTVTMKQLNFSDTASVSGFSAAYGGRAASSKQPLTDNGSTSGLSVPSDTVSSSFAGVA